MDFSYLKDDKIAVLVSGGVDSSVGLALLKKAGLNVTAFYLKIWLEDELSYLGDCPWEEDLEYVQKVCQQLQVPLEVVSLQKEYFAEVVNYTIAEVKKGRTPNPDVMCNNRIKFGLFLSKVDPSYTKIATGHYAQKEEIDGIYYLKKAPDSIKDQTYFLANLSQEQLSRAIFPIGHLPKSEVRKLAKELDLANKDRKDSQGICFLGKLKFRDFLKHYLGEKEGELLEYETDNILGSHSGFWYYTIGQRQNIRLSGGPWYVVKKDPENNKIWVSKDYENTHQSRDSFEVSEFNWPGKLDSINEVSLKIRHGEKEYKAKLEIKTGYETKETALGKVTLNAEDQGVAAGQFAVFYQDERCLGCAVIQ